MSISTILDVAIGISFVFMLLSVIASAVTEAISGILSLRSVTLRQGVERLLKDRTLTDKVYAHPLIDGLTKDDDSDPSYIPSDLFARALVDAVAGWKDGTDRSRRPERMGLLRGILSIPLRALKGFFRRLWPKAEGGGEGATKKAAVSLDDFKKRLAEAQDFEEDTRVALTALVSDASVKTLEDATQQIAAWFDRAMDSVSGWYKRTAHTLISVVGLFTAVVLNVDTFLVLDSLNRDAVLRESVASAVAESVKSESAVVKTASEVTTEQKANANAKPPEVFVDEKKTEELVRKRVVAVKRGLDELTLPMGWPEGRGFFCTPTAEVTCDRRAVPATLGGFGRRFGGWLFTAIAIALGAPFWFDLLNKLINLRAAAPPPEKARPKERTAAAQPQLSASSVGSSASTPVREQESVRPVAARSSAPPPPLS
ncbi:hypothetical protein [Polyangium jinanense]|uniref:Uncharacterized protein n=1 Tax=Polyangium jinanense TaxID=2829994 RepID=A0A9X3X1C7_9BACT|nr:hypothetical protein [Polyangium jinanense]MDC3954187.1 hypothetical protein [Polyangium jinanense]MDC3981857.1 hypothetical protein [Polyangium jinanense]